MRRALAAKSKPCGWGCLSRQMAAKMAIATAAKLERMLIQKAMDGVWCIPRR